MYKILAKFGPDEEVVDEFDTEEEAEEMLSEYALAYGSGIPLRIEEGE